MSDVLLAKDHLIFNDGPACLSSRCDRFGPGSYELFDISNVSEATSILLQLLRGSRSLWGTDSAKTSALTDRRNSAG